MVFDAGSDEVVTGLALRGGLSLFPVLDLTADFEHWPRMGRYTAWAMQIESSFYPLSHPAVAPYVLLALGYFNASNENPARPDRRGLSHGIGLGVKVSENRGFGVRLEGVLRVNAGSNDTQIRAFATLSPRRQLNLEARPEASLALSGMVPVSGPWHFVDPGYAAKFATPVASRAALGLSVTVIHWQIADPGPATAGYLWDTYAALLASGLRIRLFDGPVSLHAQAGPAVSSMIEGPDAFLRPGGQLEIAGTLERGPVPLTVSAGWLWLNRTATPSIPGGDLHGLLVSAGIRL
jgi:hypothetical protein